MPLVPLRILTGKTLPVPSGNLIDRQSPYTNTPVRAAVPALLISAALIVAVLLIVSWSPRGSAESTQVFMEAENGRLVMSVESVEIGQAETNDDDDGTTTEQVTWSAMEPTNGAMDTRDGPVLLGEGDAEGTGFTEVRLVFKEVKLARDGTLHVLAIPQDTLQVRLQEPGAAGDALLLAIDVESSIDEENGFLQFRPHVVDFWWSPGGAKNDEPPVRPPTDPQDMEPSDPSETPGRNPPTTIPSDSRSTQPGDRGPRVGWFHVALYGNGTGVVESLNTTISKIALIDQDDPDDLQTVYENERNVELVRDPQEGVAEITSMQVRPGSYHSIQIEFSDATTTIGKTKPRNLTIPQPRLVLEAPFDVSSAESVGIVIEIGVEDSIRVGLDGLEFRPVVRDYHFYDSEGRDITDPYPAQYRTGGSWLPSLGESLDETMREQEIDPQSVPHPVHGDEDRDPRSDGGLGDLDPEELDDLLNDPKQGVDDTTKTVTDEWP